MGAPRKHPPKDAAEVIERLATEGMSTIGIAKAFNVSRATIRRWFDDGEQFEEAYEQGRDSYRQALEKQIVAMTLAGKNPSGLIYLLKSKFQMYDVPSSAASMKLNLDARNIQNVLVVASHGTDQEWEASAARQQQKLALPDAIAVRS